MRQNSENHYNFEDVKRGYVIIHFLVTMFGISTWISINGIFIELPLLINVTPESWNLPAYVVIVVQSANIGPAIYALLRKCKCKLNESLIILCLLCLQVFAIGLLIFFYDKTTIIGGEKHSLILLVSIFFSALVGCFSSVLFLPYLRDFNDIYIISYFVGEGLSGVLPSVVALIQDVKEDIQCITILNNTMISVSTPISNFSVRYYFVFITFFLIFSFIAFIILQYSSFIQHRKDLFKSNFLTQSKIQLVNYKQRELDIIANVINDTQNIDHASSKKQTTDSSHIDKLDNSVLKKIYLYILIGICCFFSNGFLPSIQPYSCLPYGHLAYQMSIICTQFVNPLACFFAFWFKVSDIKIINYLSLISLIAGCYVISIALLSPTPPLQELKIGLILIVLSWIVLIAIMSYLKLIIVSLLKHTSSPKALFNVGIVMQTGSASGAIISFILINIANCFKTYNSCSA